MSRITEMPKPADPRILWVGVGEWGGNRLVTRIVQYLPEAAILVQVADLPDAWFQDRPSLITLEEIEKIRPLLWSTVREPEVRDPQPPIPEPVQRRLRESFQGTG